MEIIKKNEMNQSGIIIQLSADDIHQLYNDSSIHTVRIPYHNVEIQLKQTPLFEIEELDTFWEDRETYDELLQATQVLERAWRSLNRKLQAGQSPLHTYDRICRKFPIEKALRSYHYYGYVRNQYG